MFDVEKVLRVAIGALVGGVMAVGVFLVASGFLGDAVGAVLGAVAPCVVCVAAVVANG